MKGGFYAVYGYNRACIYDDWHKVQLERDKFIGHKVKKFLTKENAVRYIEFGMTCIYPAIKLNNFNKEALIANPLNTPIDVEDLTL